MTPLWRQQRLGTVKKEKEEERGGGQSEVYEDIRVNLQSFWERRQARNTSA